MRIIEVRMINRPQLDDFTVNSPKDLTICRMGLFSALLKLLGRTANHSQAAPLRCKSPYFFMQLFAALRSLVHDFSVIGQNQLPSEEYEALLSERLDKLESAFAIEDGYGDEDKLVERAGLSILEETDAMPDEEEEERRKSADFYPLFRRKRPVIVAEKEGAVSFSPDGEGDLTASDAAVGDAQPRSSTPAKRHRTTERENEQLPVFDLTAIEARTDEDEGCSFEEDDENDQFNNAGCFEDLEDVSLLDLPEMSIDPALANIQWQAIDISKME